MRSRKLPVRIPAKAISGTRGYMDRILGVSASKMRNKVGIISKLSKSNNSLKTDPRIETLIRRSKSKADQLTRESNSTRIKTTLLAGGVGLVGHQAMKSKQDDENYGTYYQNY